MRREAYKPRNNEGKNRKNRSIFVSFLILSLSHLQLLQHESIANIDPKSPHWQFLERVREQEKTNAPAIPSQFQPPAMFILTTRADIYPRQRTAARGNWTQGTNFQSSSVNMLFETTLEWSACVVNFQHFEKNAESFI